MLLIIGLGNPGSQYDKTYHNMGYMTLDRVADEIGVKFKDTKCKALVAEKFVAGEKVVLAKPLTYMNLSGDSVRELMGYYKATAKDIVVVYDDIDLARGGLRIRKEGSAGTHNGMRDIIAKINTKEFVRVRVGVGRPPEYMDLKDYVLSRPSGENLTLIEGAISSASQAVVKYMENRDIEAVMRTYQK